jgi:hypothetical protein
VRCGVQIDKPGGGFPFSFFWPVIFVLYNLRARGHGCELRNDSLLARMTNFSATGACLSRRDCTARVFAGSFVPPVFTVRFF